MAQVLDEMVFDSLEPIQVPVKIAGEDYVLKEADEAAAIQFRNAQSRAVQYGEDGKIARIENAGDSRILLLKLCLFRVVKAKDDRTVHQPVPPEVMKKWKNTVVGKLFDKAMEISGFVDPDTREEVEKQIAELEAKLEKMDRDEASSKNATAPTTRTSD